MTSCNMSNINFAKDNSAVVAWLVQMCQSFRGLNSQDYRQISGSQPLGKYPVTEAIAEPPQQRQSCYQRLRLCRDKPIFVGQLVSCMVSSALLYLGHYTRVPYKGIQATVKEYKDTQGQDSTVKPNSDSWPNVPHCLFAISASWLC